MVTRREDRRKSANKKPAFNRKDSTLVDACMLLIQLTRFHQRNACRVILAAHNYL